MLSEEQENSKTILAIFRAIEERDATQFRALLNPTLKSIGRDRYRIEGVGHLMYLEKPAEFSHHVINFIEQNGD